MCLSHPEDGGRPSYILNMWDGWGGDGATIANWSLLFDSVNSRRSLDCWDLQRDRKNSRDCPCACGPYRSRNVCGIGLQTMSAEVSEFLRYTRADRTVAALPALSADLVGVTGER